MLANFHAENKQLKEEQRSLLNQSQQMKVAFQKDLENYHQSFRELEEKCVQLEAELLHERRLRAEIASHINELAKSTSEPSIRARNDSNSGSQQQQLCSLSKQGSLVMNAPRILI